MLPPFARRHQTAALLQPFCGTRTLPEEAPVDGSTLASRRLPRPLRRLGKALTFNSPDPLQI